MQQTIGLEMEELDRVVIHKTMDYGMFKRTGKNRVVNRLYKLLDAVKRSNKLYSHPIIVNGDMEVIDGQHRLKVAETLQVPIYYIVDKDAKDEDMISYNTSSIPWGVRDYLNYWVMDGRPVYQFIKRLGDLYEIEPYFVIEMVCHNIKESREGNLALSWSEEEAEELVEKIATFSHWIRDYFGNNIRFRKTIYRVICKIVKENIVDLNQLKSRMINYFQDSVVALNISNVEPSYEYLIKKVYNRHNKNKIYLE